MLLLVLMVVIIVLLVKSNERTKEMVSAVTKKENELINLIRLREAGILTQEEFEQKKREYREWTDQKDLGTEKEALMDLHEKGFLTDKEYSDKLKMLEKAEERKKDITGPELAEIKRKISYKDAVCFAEKTPDSWICICGTENKLSDRHCAKCHSNQGYILENFTKENLRK